MVALKSDEILQYLPQQKPFRFVEEIMLVNEQGITGSYRFCKDEFFYAGHFPGNPVTPGVILLECMAQIGVVAFGIFLMSLQFEPSELGQWVTLFSDAEVEFCAPVYPDDKVIVTAEKIFFKRMKLKTKIEMRNPAGKLLATATAAGMGVRRS